MEPAESHAPAKQITQLFFSCCIRNAIDEYPHKTLPHGDISHYLYPATAHTHRIQLLISIAIEKISEITVRILLYFTCGRKYAMPKVSCKSFVGRDD